MMVSEGAVEQVALGWFEALGYRTLRGAEVSPGGSSSLRSSHETVLLEPVLSAALRRLNPHLPDEALEHVLSTLGRPPEPTLAQNNRWFHRLATDGVDVEYRHHSGETRGDKVRIVDFDSADSNEFHVIQQLTVVSGANTRRVDLVVFLNGIPVIVIELKDPADEHADLLTAFLQLEEYKQSISQLFAYNALIVASDGLLTRAGSVTSAWDRFSPWRSGNDSEHPGQPTLDGFISGLCDPVRLLDYLHYCITFEEDVRSGAIVKRCAAYHQFRAVLNARGSVKEALKPTGDGRGGVIWHTQGSGKSLTMLMLAGALIGDGYLRNPTIVVVTDRNDLDDQLFGTFAAGSALIRQPPEQADSRQDLANRLNRAAGGVVFTTIQKFDEFGGPISQRNNVVVLADEAHRSQYSFLAGGARWMRDALPNATFVGFTGTPLESDDRSTQAVFGRYSDIYDIRQAVEDHATVPIYYEMRLVKLVADDAGLEAAGHNLAVLTDASRDGLLPPQSVEVPLEELVGAPARIELVASEIVDHFERRSQVVEGKVMIVCMSRLICMELYDRITTLRPAWHSDADEAGQIKVVITGSSSEGLRIAHHARNKSRREALARRFKDPDDDLRLVIVCDMWLTGFDCPPMHTMYLDKPLAGHNLMQAIARVNRVFGEKPGGVVVDFLGIADQLRDAVQVYTRAGGGGSPVESIQGQAVPIMLRQYETLRDFFNGFEYAAFFAGTEKAQLKVMAGALNFVLAQEDGRQRFMTLVSGLSKSFALAVPRAETEAVRDFLGFCQAVRVAIRKYLADDESLPATTPDSRAAVRQIIAGAIASDGVIDLFEAAGLPHQDVGILSDEFLDRLAVLPQKNLALETLRKLLNDEIRSREKVNLVQSRGFREALERILTLYTNRAVTTAQVLQELLNLARLIREAVARGEESDLTPEEGAFYDALADNQSAREVLKEETLKLIARDLSERIRSKATLDWTEREAVRADIRRTVRRLLAKYGYPPDAQESATALIIRQAELSTDVAVRNWGGPIG